MQLWVSGIVNNCSSGEMSKFRKCLLLNLVSSFISKRLDINIKIIIFPVVLYKCVRMMN
jgi:hypothetical protein